MQELLEQIGLQPQRVNMYNMSSAMAGQFAAGAKEMTEQITNLGPNPLKEKDEGGIRKDEGGGQKGDQRR